MSCDAPYISYMALYIISMQLVNTNSRTSHHWKLNPESGKVLSAEDFDSDNPNEGIPEDPLFDILTSRIQLEDGNWKLEAELDACSEDCKKNKSLKKDDVNMNNNNTSTPQSQTSQSTKNHTNDSSGKHQSGQDKHGKANSTCNGTTTTSACGMKQRLSVLDCGKAVNFTVFDHLRGILYRSQHPLLPEPDVAKLVFKKKGSRSLDMDELERRLRKAKLQNPKSSQVYIQIGNYQRIRGDTQLAIDCFRKSLSLSPGNADALLHLARILLHLRYLDDALLLTRRSLEALSGSSRGSAWLQHFTLGEILAAGGERHEATLHLRHCLDLNPGFGPALAQLRDMRGPAPDTPVTRYTLFIILFLALGVLCGILTSVDSGAVAGNSLDDGGSGDVKTPRHFNRAMAMRSIKLGINPRLIRTRKQAVYAS